MNLLQSILVYFISPLLGLLQLIMIVYMIMSWLVAFNVINLRNPVAGQIFNLCRSIVEPLLAPFRRFIPPIGGLDLAFLAVFMLLYWVKGFVVPALYGALG